MKRCAYRANGLKVGRSLVLKVARVGNLAWRPHSLVIWVVDERRSPLALVQRVLGHRRRPRTTTRSFFTLGVGNLRWNPVTILFVIPVLWLLGFWIGDRGWLVLKPVIWFLSFFIDNLVWLILIPVLRLGGLRIRDAGLFNPVFRLLVLGIVNFLLGIDCGREIFQKGTILSGLVIDQHFESVVGLDDQGVQGREFASLGLRWALEVLLLVFAGLWVLVLEDEMHLHEVRLIRKT
jgi:hypothetical protein